MTPSSVVDVYTPEEAGQQLAQVLAALLCRGLAHGAEQTCDRCLAAGRVLARPVGRALVQTRRSRSGLTPADYAAIGQALELLEREAGIRSANGRRR